jgi:hypothetical protein
MTHRKIKIIKRDSQPEPQAPPDDPPEIQEDTDRGISNAVKGWISERRENSIAERDSVTAGSNFGRSKRRTR